MTLFDYIGYKTLDEYDFFAEKYGLPRPPKTLEDVRAYFKKLKEGIRENDPLAVELGYRISYGACRPDIWKEHTAAKFIENFVSSFLKGQLTKSGERPPVEIPRVPENIARHLPNYNDFVQTVRRAALEKTDLYFRETGLRLSLKSLIPQNQELNVGSFQPRLLFAGFLKVIPEERKGMGSARRLLILFNQIKEEGKWELFLERFKYMVDAIFDNIHFLVLERHPYPAQKLVVYTIESEKFRNLLKTKAEAGPEELTSIFYRFELHAMRLRKGPVIEVGEKIEIPLPNYNKSPLLKYINFLKNEYNKRLLLGKISIDEFKEKVQGATASFLEEIEKMFRKGV